MSKKAAECVRQPPFKCVPNLKCGQTHDIVIGPENPEDHLKNKYTNTLIGRYTNRLPVGTHTISKKTNDEESTEIKSEVKVVAKNDGMFGL